MSDNTRLNEGTAFHKLRTAPKFVADPGNVGLNVRGRNNEIWRKEHIDVSLNVVLKPLDWRVQSRRQR